ncbi:MAG TPA: Hsp20/alpha crystallin family protein [Nitriliruptorales bacterium]
MNRALSQRTNTSGDVIGIQDEMERFLRTFLGDTSAPSTAGAWSPSLDVEENQDAFVLHVELPGVSPDDIEVNLEESVLTVTGERNFYGERDAENFRRVERRFGRFHRSVRLPDRVKPDAVEATYRDGLMTITVPKAEEAKPRRIEVRAG